MKNKLKLLMAAVAAGLIGCAATMDGPVDPELVCRDREVTVIHAPAYLAAHPEHIKICPGQNLVIKFRPRPTAGARTEGPVEGQARWLTDATDEGDDEIVLKVPREKGIEGEYKYSITVKGVGTLDPRVTVAKY